MEYTNYKIVFDAICVPGNRLFIERFFASSEKDAVKKATKKVLDLLAGPALKWLLDVKVEQDDYWVITGIPKDIIPEEYKNCYLNGMIKFHVIKDIPYWRGKSVVENYCTYSHDSFHNVSTHCEIKIPRSWVKVNEWSKGHGPQIQVPGGSYSYNSDLHEIYFVGGNTYAEVIIHDDNLPGSIVTREDAEIRYFQR